MKEEDDDDDEYDDEQKGEDVLEAEETWYRLVGRREEKAATRREKGGKHGLFWRYGRVTQHRSSNTVTGVEVRQGNLWTSPDESRAERQAAVREVRRQRGARRGAGGMPSLQLAKEPFPGLVEVQADHRGPFPQTRTLADVHLHGRQLLPGDPGSGKISSEL